ncbi:Uncharacterised protein [Vibrio cholerae]|nr:Uncharacterised protein [Vibrio cholerae]CSE12843.1 Uncharacterised protein [Vibrio cholerae]
MHGIGQRMERVYYDLLPDGSVSVYLFGAWDTFRTYRALVSYLQSECIEYELIDITETTLAERLVLMGMQL